MPRSWGVVLCSGWWRQLKAPALCARTLSRHLSSDGVLPLGPVPWPQSSLPCRVLYPGLALGLEQQGHKVAKLERSKIFNKRGKRVV